MTLLTLLSDSFHLIVAVTDPKPEDSEVAPGPMMAVVVLLLVAASVLLWFSLRKQLRKIQVPREGSGAHDAAPHDPDAAGEDDRPSGSPPVS